MAKTKKKEIDWKTSCTAILCLTALELAAMHYGINGLMRTAIFTIIALIVGIQIPSEALAAMFKKL